MKNYMIILQLAYLVNIILVSYSNLMIKNITIFNYKNSTNFTENKAFFDIFYSFFYNKYSFLRYLYTIYI